MRRNERMGIIGLCYKLILVAGPLEEVWELVMTRWPGGTGRTIILLAGGRGHKGDGSESVISAEVLKPFHSNNSTASIMISWQCLVAR